MNFLAHLFLSGDDPAIKTGNFIGDFVKGRVTADRFDPGIVQGIALHREIDWFTDRHPVVKHSKDRLRPKYRHYSGVIVDMYYDHFLAKNWSVYTSMPLTDFAADCYDILWQHGAVLPDGVAHLLTYMASGNWLVNYARMEGLARALSGMARRTRFASRMEESTDDLQAHYQDFENEFTLFFPDIIEHCQHWRATSGPGS